MDTAHEEVAPAGVATETKAQRFARLMAAAGSRTAQDCDCGKSCGGDCLAHAVTRRGAR